MAWFAKMQSGSLSRSEQAAFEQWRSQSADHEKMFDDIATMWDDPALLEASQHFVAELPEQQERPLHWWGAWNWGFPQAGATFALMGILVIGAWQFNVMTWMQADYYTSTGEQRTVQLPDQSMLTLNAESAVAVEFEEAIRRIRLIKGKAFFEVKSDPARPFVVEQEDLQVRAIGTAFIVKEQTEGVRVTVVEGLVQLRHLASDWSPLSLEAERQVDIVNGAPGPVQSIDSGVVTAWLRGRLMVDTMRLEDVIQEVRPYHSGTILLLNADIENLKVSGNYNLSDTDGILSALSTTLPIQTLSFANHVTVFF